jgi:hypothetical protein
MLMADRYLVREVFGYVFLKAHSDFVLSVSGIG